MFIGSDLPQWAQGNPYKLTYGNRMELESDQVSQFLNDWIDVAFGHGSLTQGPFPNRYAFSSSYVFVDEKCNCTTFRQKPFNSKPVLKTISIQSDQAIQSLQFISKVRFSLVRKNGLVQHVRLDAQNTEPMTFEIIWEIDYQMNLKQFEFYQDSNTSDILPMILLKAGRYLAVGGYWDGRLVIYEIEQERVHEVLEDNTSTITTIASDLKNQILATGTKSGCLTIYSLMAKNLKLIKQIHDHDAEINDIFICQDLKAILTCSSDGWAHLYNMFTGKYFRSFQNPYQTSIDRAVIYTTPLYGVALYSSDKQTVYSYSINGQFLTKKQLSSGQIMLQVSKDSKLNDILVIDFIVIKASEKTQLHLTTPFLMSRQEFRFTNYQQSLSDILSFSISQDRKVYAFGTKDGEVGLGLDLRNHSELK